MSNTKIVKTFNGKRVERSKCRYISGRFYEINVNCFKMSDGKWHRINNGLIEFDYEKEKWVLKANSRLVNGIIEISNDEIITGNFTPNEIKNIYVNVYGRRVLCISKDVLTKNYVEILSNGVFINTKEKSINGNWHLKKNITERYPFRLNYSFEHEFPRFKNYYDNNFTFDKSNLNFHNELGSTTFGIEFETYNGQIPIRYCFKNGLIPLKDGSLRHDNINPYEYTTIPLSKEKGLHTIKDSCDLLNKYCVNSVDGSLHIHIGSIERTKEYGVALYRLLFNLQDEIYDLFPLYFKNTSKFKNSGKDYCKPLPKIKFSGNTEKDSEKLFQYYINGRTENENQDAAQIENDLREMQPNDNPIVRLRRYKRRKKDFYMGMPHPNDSSFDHKWYTEMRYHFCNLLPLFYNKRNTVEFRIHTSTFNSDKVINWLFIINAICKFAKENECGIVKSGIKVNLDYIFEKIYSSELAKYLSSYIRFRKEMMKTHSKKGDNIGEIEVKDDSLKEWHYPFKSLI